MKDEMAENLREQQPRSKNSSNSPGNGQIEQKKADKDLPIPKKNQCLRAGGNKCDGVEGIHKNLTLIWGWMVGLVQRKKSKV